MANKGGVSRRRLRILPTVLLTVAILGLPTAVYALGRSSSSFEVTRVGVSGLELVSRTKAAMLLRADYVGENLFKITAADVRESLRPLAYVSNVEVDRAFPDTLKVRVIEHQPALYVLATNGWFVVADDGHVICAADVGPGESSATGQDGASQSLSSQATVEGSPAPDASAAAGAGGASAERSAGLTQTAQDSPALRNGPPSGRLHLPRLALGARLRPGSTVSQQGVRAALHVVDALPASLRRELNMVQVSAQGVVTLRLDRGLVVRWGDRQRSLAKAISLTVVVDAYRRVGKQASFLDVSLPDRVIARPIFK
jgi:cell division septal protein FtsQ